MHDLESIYRLHFYTVDWVLLCGAAGVCSLVWLLYSLSVRRKIQSISEPDGAGVSKSFPKKRLILTVLFVVSLMPMLLNQYGGRRGVQEISGLINLFNPIGFLSAAAFLLGVWGRYRRKMWNQILGLTGTVGIVISELYEFFTWYIPTITGQFSLKNSIRFAFPEFYVGLLFSGAMIVAYVLIDKKMFD